MSDRGTFTFDGIPSFSPEHFVRLDVAEVSRRKSLSKGLEQLTQEGLVQLFTEPGAGSAAMVLGAVGPLQFDVLKFRMQSEYKVELRLSPLSMKVARWPTAGWDPSAFRYTQSAKLLQDREKRPVLLFDSPYTVRWILEKYPGLELSETPD